MSDKQSGAEIFILDNSDKDWRVREYLKEWADISHQFDIATGYLPLLRFWQSLLNLGEGRSPLHTRMSPSERSYIGANSGVSGLTYYYVASRQECRVELYIDKQDVEFNKRIFDELLSYKDEIEAAFGEPLSWRRLETKRTCRIRYDINVGGYKTDEADWQTIQLTMIDAMIRLERAFSPVLSRLSNLNSGVL